MKANNKTLPHCFMCGECCINTLMMTKFSDIIRWIFQGRFDILKHASLPNLKGYGYLKKEMSNGELSKYCYFAVKRNSNKYFCSIHRTKPIVCKEFYCEKAYNVGGEGIPFKTESGWSEKATQLGYSCQR